MKMSTIARRSLAVAVSCLIAIAASLVVGVSPANAAGACRTPYTTGGWYVYPCISTVFVYPPNGGPAYKAVEAFADVFNRPAACSGYRVYIVDEQNVQRFSTSLRPCGETYSPYVTKWNGEFGGLRVKARFKTYNSSGSQILSIDSPLISSL